MCIDPSGRVIRGPEAATWVGVGLFSGPRAEPRQQPVRTLNGRRQQVPEGPGTVQRRARLFSECARRLSTDPLASEQACEVPIGDGLGLEGLVAKIEPIFRRERSLIRWVALRGAITHLYIHTFDPESRSVPFYPTVEMVMGVGHLSEPGDPNEVIGVGPDWSDRLDADQQTAAANIYRSVWVRLLDYERYSQLSVQVVNAEAHLQVNQAIGLDIIAWACVAALRLGHEFGGHPKPDVLNHPGWYVEPLFGKTERYWDGTDWTQRCRVQSGRQYHEQAMPLC
jgi:Protein of unknown function (DUF2510)